MRKFPGKSSHYTLNVILILCKTGIMIITVVTAKYICKPKK